MNVERIFYVTQEALSVWTYAGGRLERTAVFGGNEGLREFDAYVSLSSQLPSAMLVDLIEEEFTRDTIPKLGARDRSALLLRRAQRKYPRTHFRLSELQGKAGHGGEEFKVLLSAITNHELVDAWLQVLLRYSTPLAGIHSVPHMAPYIFGRLFDTKGPALFVAQHQGKKLRQAFIRKDQLQSARLSHSPMADEDFAQFVVTEANRSRRYLERLRLLSNMEILDVCVVTDAATAERVKSLTEDEVATQFTFLDPDAAARKLHAGKALQHGHFESVYLRSLFKRRPKRSYAVSGENRYWLMRRMRHAIIGAATALAAVCSMLATFYFCEAWLLKGGVDDLRAQAEQLEATYRKEHERFSPILAGSHEMQLAVDTVDFILEHRLPVPWVMNQVSAVLDDYPDVQLRGLYWLADSAETRKQNARRRSSRKKKIDIPEIDAVGAVLTADITPFDGDMRRAFSRIDALAADLQSKTTFNHAVTVEYPLNADPDTAVSGEIGAGPADFARFSIRVTYDVPDVETKGDG